MKTKLGVLLLFLSILSISATTAHAFYISLTVIEYNDKRESLEFSTKFFVDDLQKVFEQEYEINYDVTDTDQQDKMEVLLEDYLSKHLTVNIDGVRKEVKYVGVEMDIRKMWFYYEVEGVKKGSKEMSLKNTFFYRVINGQKNIFNFKLNRYKKALVFEQDNDSQVLEIEDKF